MCGAVREARPGSRLRPCALLVLLATACGTARAGGDEYDCTRGCDLAASAAPVCGADGVTYQAACLAACQGVAIKDAAGPCRPQDAAMLNAKLPAALAAAVLAAGDGAGGPGGVVDLETINRFKDQGMFYVGKGRVSGDPPGAAPASAEPAPAFQPQPDGAAPSPGGRALRFVYDTQDLYISGPEGVTLPYDVSEAAAALRAANPAPPAAKPAERTKPGGGGNKGSLGRKLSLLDPINADFRSLVSDVDALTLPMSAITLLQSEDRTNGPAARPLICSGALISSASVLTAASCVYDRATNSFYRKIQASPGHTKDLTVTGGTGPFGLNKGLALCVGARALARARRAARLVVGFVAGAFACVHTDDVMLDQAYITAAGGSQHAHDMAVVSLSQPIGNAPGFMDLTPADDTYPKRNIYLAGYSSDYIDGLMLTDWCPGVDDLNPGDGVTRIVECSTQPNDINQIGGFTGAPGFEVTLQGRWLIRGIVTVAHMRDSDFQAYNYMKQMTIKAATDALVWATTCRTAKFNCATCVAGSATICATCQPGFTRADGVCTCVPGPNCAAPTCASGASICKECAAGFVLYKGQCFKACPTPNFIGETCTECTPGYGGKKCIACKGKKQSPGGNPLSSGKCVACARRMVVNALRTGCDCAPGVDKTPACDKCLPGFGGPLCKACKGKTVSPGGSVAKCIKCPTGSLPNADRSKCGA
ncbi:MAG: hypothetical protein J3K34DRAFT_498164 [Monoraphidium minutum]|nr:MAG: hypothetical protein J3K34DRAFT_498164 [Monoraphidium minutum]